MTIVGGIAVQNNYEQLFLQRLFQGEQGWVQAVYLAGMFAIVLWRKESVVNWRLFRMSYLLYGASLVLPPILTPLIQFFFYPNAGAYAGGQVFTYIFISALGPLLFAAAVICALGSMLPRLIVAQPAGPPTKHPLD